MVQERILENPCFIVFVGDKGYRIISKWSDYDHTEMYKNRRIEARMSILRNLTRQGYKEVPVEVFI